MPIKWNSQTFSDTAKAYGVFDDAQAFRAERKAVHESEGFVKEAGKLAWHEMVDRYGGQLERLIELDGGKAIKGLISKPSVAKKKLMNRRAAEPKLPRLLAMNVQHSVFKGEVASRGTNRTWVGKVIYQPPEEIEFSECPSVEAFNLLLTYIDRPADFFEKVYQGLKLTKEEQDQERRKRTNPEIRTALEAARRAFDDRRHHNAFVA